MAQFEAGFTGIDECHRKLRNFALRDEMRITRKAVSQGLTIMARAIKSRAPKFLKKTIGKKAERSSKRSKIRVSKVGVNVGKKADPDRWYLRLHATGTAQRKTSRGARRGSLKPRTFVADGFQASRGAAFSKMREVIQKEIEKIRA